MQHCEPVLIGVGLQKACSPVDRQQPKYPRSHGDMSFGAWYRHSLYSCPLNTYGMSQSFDETVFHKPALI